MKIRGFTLIETLVYIALYAIIIVGALSAVYGIFDTGSRNESIAMVEEEGDFLIGKIDWALSGAMTIQSPVTTGPTLTVVRSDGSTIAIDTASSRMRIKENISAREILSNSNVRISPLNFIHELPTSDGVNPESVQASFTMSATTSDGHAFSRDFSILKYLRK